MPWRAESAGVQPAAPADVPEGTQLAIQHLTCGSLSILFSVDVVPFGHCMHLCHGDISFPIYTI